MTENDESRIQEFFEKKINESGHTLEELVENKLRDEGFRVASEVSYLDKDESKGRTTDIVANAIIPTEYQSDQQKLTFGGELRLIIECKNLPDHAWIFFGDNSSLEQREFVPTSKEFDMQFFLLRLWPTKYVDIPLATRYSEYILDSGGSKSQKTNNKDKNLYEAILSVIKATKHNKESFQKESQSSLSIFQNIRIVPHIGRPLSIFSFFQSVIVFSGRMYMAQQTTNNKWGLEPINQIQIKKSYISQNYNETEGQIHIINYKSLPHYIKKIREYYNQGTEKILEDQETYEKILKNIKFQ